MNALIAARAQMEVSLAFHMIFAALGIGLPLLMLIAEGFWLRTGLGHYRDLARTWSKATALAFAVGAVSGTALSFELGLLWPRFMAAAGGVLGPAFALEGYAFFIEAIFLGLYLYGWDRLSPRAHWLAGVPVAVSGLLSGILVVAANAWMQVPTGVDPASAGTAPLPLEDPLAVFRSPAWFQMALHSSLSCYIATGFAVAGVYATGLLGGRRNEYHRSGLRIAMAVGTCAAILQPFSGDLSARNVAEYQPAKLAAAEAHYETSARAPLTLGGIPTGDGEVRYAIRIPGGLSMLAHHDRNAVVLGLDAFPEDEWPNVLITHLAFQLMVGLGFAMVALGVWFWWVHRRHPRDWDVRPLLLRTLVIASPAGFLALQAGWIVTEVGRQPWVIYGMMRTADGVTPVRDVPITLFGFIILYLALGTTLALLLRELARSNRHSGRVGSNAREPDATAGSAGADHA